MSLSDYLTVRNDPNYPEKLDAEIIPLCDALNEAGFASTSSCCGHGGRWPAVWFEHESDAAVEELARAIMKTEQHPFPLHSSVFEKKVLPDGYLWSLHIHLHEVFTDTTPEVFLHKAVIAMDVVAKQIRAWTGDGVLVSDGDSSR